MRVEINCTAWGARQLYDEARALDAKAAEARAEGNEAAAAVWERNAHACRTAGRNSLIAAGLPDDENIEPETWSPLTAEEIAQRGRDAEERMGIAWRALRAQRDALLVQSDWTELPSRQAAMDAEKRKAWAAYRTQLLDLPATTTDPHSPQWPTPPG